jgi:hypothetical protein
MTYEVGQLVEHPKMGLGKVLKVTRHVLKVFFKDESENPKEISTSYALLKVSAQQSDPWLDLLDVDLVLRGKATRFLTHQQAIERFLHIFPKAFSDPQYFERERNYKWAAHELWNELLSQPTFAELLTTRDYKEIVQRALQVERSTNLLATFEKIALRDAVKETSAAERFSIGLFDLVYGSEPFQSRFEKFARVLDVLPQGNTGTAKWPIQTIFLFLAQPGEHIFLKPTVTQQAAERRAFSLNYKPQPNWLTYSCLLRLSELLKKDLADLKPRDMIDVQSFLWVTGEGTYGDA